MEELSKINEVIEHVPIDNITELNDTFYASAAIVTKKLARNWNEKKEEPPWKKRLKAKVMELRKDISRVMQARNKPHNDGFRRRIEVKHNIKRKGYQLVEEELKQRLKATAAKIKRYCYICKGSLVVS